MNKEETSLSLCPICYEGELREKSGDRRFKIKDGGKVREITISNLHWLECEKCGEVVFDNAVAQQIEKERYRALGLLTPDELRSIRKELGFTQEDMAEFLKVGSKSYCRWENGSLIQSKSMDALIRYAYADEQKKGERSQRVKRATGYLSQLKKMDSGRDKNDLLLAAHSKNVSSDELQRIGKKVFRKR